MSSGKKENSSTIKSPLSGIYPEGLISRLNWRPSYKAGKDSVLGRVSGHVKPFLKTTGRLMNFYDSFGISFRPWPHWDRLSMSYNINGKGYVSSTEEDTHETGSIEFNAGQKATANKTGSSLSPSDYIALSYELAGEANEAGTRPNSKISGRGLLNSLKKNSVSDLNLDSYLQEFSENEFIYESLKDNGRERDSIKVREIIGKNFVDIKPSNKFDEIAVQVAGLNNSLFSNFTPDSKSGKFEPVNMNPATAKTVRKEVPGGFPVEKSGAVNLESTVIHADSPQQKISNDRAKRTDVFETEMESLPGLQNTVQIASDQTNEFIEKLHDFSKPPVSLDAIDINILNSKKTIKEEIKKSGEQIKMDIQNNIAENVHNIRTSAPNIDIDEIANKVSKKLEQKQRLERERKGN